MKTLIVALVLSGLASCAWAEAVILKSGERYIGEVTEEGDSYRIKNETFPDGIVVKKENVKTIYPKPEELLERITRVVDQAKSKYEEGKKAADPNSYMKAAVDMLFDPELEAAEAAEIYPAKKQEFAALTTSIHELRKMCRDAQNLGAKSPPDPAPKPGPKPAPADPKNPPAKPDPKDPAGPAPKNAPPKAVPANEMTAALETIKSGPASDLVATLSKFDDGKEERLCPPMIERLKTETDAQAKTVLKEALTKYPGFVIVRTVENALKAKGVSEEFKKDCADILAGKKEDKAISILTDISFASDARETRAYGRDILSAHGNACLKSVNRYIHHPDARTRVDAVEFVAAIDTPEAYAVLCQCLIIGTSQELMKASSIDVPLRDLCTDKLVKGGDKACPGLVSSLGNGNLRKWANFCLQKISGENFNESDLKSWSAWWKKRQSELQGK